MINIILSWIVFLSSLYPVSFAQAHFRAPCDTTPGLADSHVLAVSWQPAFCETHGYEDGKPECLHLSKHSFYANHMTLHGLWPNQKNCGPRYGYCGAESLPTHCSYSPVNLSPAVSAQLKKYMPSYAYGSCLERHEWNRHGTCQLLSSNDYFALALRLTEELNDSSFVAFIQSHAGDIVALEQLKKEFDNVYGKDAHQKVRFGCRRNRLVDVYIQLPALVPYSDSLQTLVRNAAKAKIKSRCPQTIRISNFSVVDNEVG